MMNKPTLFEQEIFLTARKRSYWACVVAGLSLGVAVASVSALAALIPLKETRPYLFLLDKTNGAMERVVEVQPMDIAEEDAVIQANIVRYVIDRETYDTYDNQERIKRIIELSDEDARKDMLDIWDNPETNQDHPDNIYGQNIRIRAIVKSVTLDPVNSTALVFTTLIRKQRSIPDVVAQTVISLGYVFDPASVQSQAQLWNNPLGFKIINYRLDRQSKGNSNE